MAEVVAKFHEALGDTGQVVIAVIFYLANASTKKHVAGGVGLNCQNLRRVAQKKQEKFVTK